MRLCQLRYDTLPWRVEVENNCPWLSGSSLQFETRSQRRQIRKDRLSDRWASAVDYLPPQRHQFNDSNVEHAHFIQSIVSASFSLSLTFFSASLSTHPSLSISRCLLSLTTAFLFPPQLYCFFRSFSDALLVPFSFYLLLWIFYYSSFLFLSFYSYC